LDLHEKEKFTYEVGLRYVMHINKQAFDFDLIDLILTREVYLWTEWILEITRI